MSNKRKKYEQRIQRAREDFDLACTMIKCVREEYSYCGVFGSERSQQLIKRAIRQLNGVLSIIQFKEKEQAR